MALIQPVPEESLSDSAKTAHLLKMLVTAQEMVEPKRIPLESEVFAWIGSLTL